jgi:hypothetical protein
MNLAHTKIKNIIARFDSKFSEIIFLLFISCLVITGSILQGAYNNDPLHWGDVYTDLIKEQNKTTNTNCQVYGNTVNCQSY